jgi:hypothetical protein
MNKQSTEKAPPRRPETPLYPCGLLALAVASALLAGCAKGGPMDTSPPGPVPAPVSAPVAPPMVPLAQVTCSAGKVAMDPRSTFAVYIGIGDKVKAVEEVRGLAGRCIRAESSAPPAPPAPPAAAPAPACPTDTKASPPDAYYVEYFTGNPVTQIQIENLKGEARRCIKALDSTSGAGCPPPAGYHIELIRGVQYCVPN